MKKTNINKNNMDKYIIAKNLSLTQQSQSNNIFLHLYYFQNHFSANN